MSHFGSGPAMSSHRGRLLAILAILALLAALPAIPAGAQDQPERLGGVVADPGLSPALSVIADGGPGVAAGGVAAPGQILQRDGRFLTYIRVTDGGAGLRQAIQAIGVEITHVSEEYGVITALADANQLKALAALDGVRYVEEALAPARSDDGSVTGACPTGGAFSEADGQLNADLARRDFAVDGTGVTVGVLSDSYDANGLSPDASDDIASEDLPGAANGCGRLTAVEVLDEFTGAGIDEGRAMLQLVHDLAPSADLSFATAFGGIYAFADNIRALRAAGADVIVDDVSYFEEPMFQPGPVNTAVDDVVAAGATYLSSAGNNNIVIGGNDVGSYEAPQYRPGVCPAAVAVFTGYDSCHDFDPALASVDTTLGLTLDGDLSVNLQWAEPWNGVVTDLAIFVLDSTGEIAQTTSGDPVVSDRRNVAASQTPFELVRPREILPRVPGPFEVVVARATTVGQGAPRLKLNLGGSRLIAVEYDESAGGDVVGPTIFGHNGAANAISLGATRYNDGVRAEPFSSHGPLTHYFGEVDGPTPALPLPEPNVLDKPDVTATDGACTTFFGELFDGCDFRFFGTSAAAPHAAAVVALVREAAPDMTPAEISALLEGTAAPMTGGPDVVGSGLVDARAALDDLRPIRVAATSRPEALRVTWNPPPTEPGRILGYRLRAFADGVRVGSPVDVGDVGAATLTGLTAGRTYTVTVAARTRSGEVLQSDPSNPAVPAGTVAPAPDTDVPGPPTNVRGSAGDEQARVSWTAPTDDGGTAITGYRVRTFEGGTRIGPVTSVGAASRSADVVGLTNGSSYTFTVSAVNADGEGAQSAASSPVTPESQDDPPTDPPSDPPTDPPTDPPSDPLIAPSIPLGPSVVVLPPAATSGDNSDVSVAVAQLTFPDATTAPFAPADGQVDGLGSGSVDEVLVASELVFADALASGSLQGDRALLLNDPAELEPEVLGEIQRLGATSVRILGGEAAVSGTVADALEAEGLRVFRTAGPTRLETATAIAALGDNPDAFLARAFPAPEATDPTQGFADSLAVGGWAADTAEPVLLTQTEVLSTSTVAELATNQVDALQIIGGMAAISEATSVTAAGLVGSSDRLAGSNRFSTATDIATARGFSAASPATSVIVVEGQNENAWAAGFTVAALSARANAPIILANGDLVPVETQTFLENVATENVQVTCAASTAACEIVRALIQ